MFNKLSTLTIAESKHTQKKTKIQINKLIKIIRLFYQQPAV